MKKLLLFALILAFATSCGGDDAPTEPDKNETNYSFYWESFKIIKDESQPESSSYYYRISVLDKDGNPYKDEEGDECVISISRDDSYQPNNEYILNVGMQFDNVKIKEGEGEKIMISVDLFDYKMDGSDIPLGSVVKTYDYPWDNIEGSWGLELMENDYEAEFKFNIWRSGEE